MLALANIEAAFCVDAVFSADVVLGDVKDLTPALLPLLCCISKAACCAPGRSALISAWYSRPNGLVLLGAICGNPVDAYAF